MKTLSAVRDIARQFLRDELTEGRDFADDELKLHLDECLVEISQKRPYEARETVVSGGSREVDVSSIEGLLDVEKAEYPVGNYPPDYRNISRFGNTVTLEVESVPTSGDTIYLYCHKVHELTESQSTLSPDMENVLIQGVVAKAVLAWVNQIRVEIGSAITTIQSLGSAVDAMTDRIAQSVSDLTSGRLFIGKKNTEAIGAIDKLTAVGGPLTQAIADLSSGRSLIAGKRTEALAAIDSMSAQLTQAASDLTTGRAKIEDTRTSMDTAVDNMSARITQAINDLTTGRSLINKINIGGAPEDDYARYATTELGNALRYLNQSQGYLSQATTSDRYANYAARDLQIAVGYLNQARGYLASDAPANQYATYAAREIANAATYLNQARSYLSIDQPATLYGTYAARELANAMANLNKATGYARKATAQLNVAAAITRYQAWANNQFALYQASLRNITEPKSWIYYPRS